MIVTSDTEPQPVEVDRTEKGTARVLVRWNITPVSVAVDGAKARIAYEYEERAVWVTAADPVKALETRTAGLVDASTKEMIGTVRLVADTAGGLPGKTLPVAADPTIEADEAVRARRESAYRVLPPPRATVRLPTVSAAVKPPEKDLDPLPIEIRGLA